MSDTQRLKIQVDTAAVLDRLQDLIWDPAIDPATLKHVCGDLAGMAVMLEKQTHAVQKDGPPLPRRTAETLSFIRAYFEEHNHAPAIRDIQKGLRFQSSSSAAYHVRQLLELGYIEMPSHLARSMRLLEQPR